MLKNSYRVASYEEVDLSKHDPGEKSKLTDEQIQEEIKKKAEKLAELQEKLYAEKEWALLIILQGVDAAGKDSAIKNLFTNTNPIGITMSNFGVPSEEELRHDFLWRAVEKLPERGNIAIFNRSYYEEVLAVRVEPGLLAKQKLPEELTGEDIWTERYEDINNFEKHLTRNGTCVLKFFLHVSKNEHLDRLKLRLSEEDKNWKFSKNDHKMGHNWNEYQHAAEEMLSNTSRKDTPWYVLPSDNKWLSRLIMMDAIIDKLEALELDYPKFSSDKKRRLGMKLASKARAKYAQ